LATAPAPVLSELTIADPPFRRSVLALRWLLLGLWIALVEMGVLDVSGVALLVSAAILAAYDIFHVALELRGAVGARLYTVTRHLDVVTVTVPLIALHDVRNPVFTIYFLTMIGAAHMVSRKEMFEEVGWVCANYLAFVVITAALGHPVPWAYVTVVTVGLAMMGLNATILAGGEQRLREVIASMAVTDALTGLPNRRRFHEAYPMSLDEAIEKRTPLALLLIDFDHFKLINDREGHPAGDDKLREVAQALQSAIRGQDLVARYGGDEFIVVAPHSSRDDARALAERLRVAAESSGASVSIGLAVYPEDAELHDALIEAADAALYRAKEAGRNCVREAVAA
jgi:diguanylate cyclase (GGDEF)-like protein